MPVQIRCKRCRGAIERSGARPALAVRCPRCGFTFSPGRGDAGATRHLRLRSDLVIEPVEESDQLVYVIKDPKSQRFFRVKPLEYFLVSQFDGATPLETIRRRASEEKRVLVSEEVLGKFAEKFRSLGLLVGGAGESVDGGPAPGRPERVGPLSFKLPFASPDRLVDWLYPKTRFFVSAPFVGLASLTILFAIALTIANREHLAVGLAGAVSVEGLALVLATLSAVTLLHELAHAVTCRHYGGRVSDMGVLFLYLLPCFYVNVSDTYLFRQRRQRLAVLFAGGFFELFVWALAVVGWRVAAPETFASRVFFVVAAVCGIRSLFNFNPLIKMDGYFMLSDYLGIPNLRREALSGLGRALRRAARLDAPPAAPEIRERRIFSMPAERFLALFGGTAIVYTVLLVGLLVAYSGGLVFESYGTDALAVLSLGLVGLLHKPAFTAASAAKDAGKEKWQKLGEEKKRSRFALLWGGLLLAGALFPWPLRVPSELSVFPRERETVRAPFAGRIAEIHVSEGDTVEAGELILEYDADELRLRRRAKEAELQRAVEELRIIEGDGVVVTLREEIVLAERRVEAARVREGSARREFTRAQELWTLGLIPKDELDGAEDALNVAVSERREAEAALAFVKKRVAQRLQEENAIQGKSPEAQHETIRKLESELAALDDAIARTKIYASISGTVTTYRFEEKVGDYLEEGAEVCEIVDDDEVVVEMPVAEKDMDVIEDGLSVKFKVRGYPTRSFHATVDEIAPVATPNGGSATILVRSYVDNEDKILKPGMTGVAKIYCGMSVMAHILTRDLIRFVRTEFWL